MDAQRKAEIAARIKQLRVDSPYTQDKIAGLVGLGVRGYQKWEEAGSISHENAEKLAEIHAEWTNGLVTVEYIMGKSDTMKALEALNAATQFDAIEARLERIETALSGLVGVDYNALGQEIVSIIQAAEDAAGRPAQGTPRSEPTSQPDASPDAQTPPDEEAV